MEQIQAAAETDIDYIYADFEFTTNYPEAVKTARESGKKIALATPRIHMPGENGILTGILRAEPDAILVRSLGALQFYTSQQLNIPLIGDYSFNVANHLSVDLFLERGLNRVTPSYDLNIQQMMDLLENSQTEKLELVVHQHLPMFHTEHCIYCTFLSQKREPSSLKRKNTFLSEGTDFTNCGRPCDKHRVSLEDRIGMKHPVRVDIGCRNTVYNAIEQSGAEYLSQFKSLGVNTFRIEFLEEDYKKVKEVISLYREALDGKRNGTSVWKTLKATDSQKPRRMGWTIVMNSVNRK